MKTESPVKAVLSPSLEILPPVYKNPIIEALERIIATSNAIDERLKKLNEELEEQIKNQN